MKSLLVTLFFLLGIFSPTLLDAASMNGGSYSIFADSFAVIDTGPLTSASYSAFGSVSEAAATTTSDGTYTLRGGFQAAEQGILSFTLSGATVALGTLSTSTIASAIVTTTISTDSETGYTLNLTEDGNLRSGSENINDVTDGAVTIASEEYGIRTAGADGLLTSDTAISGTVNVASVNGAVTDRQTGVVFRASMSSATVAGAYSHIVTFGITVNP